MSAAVLVRDGEISIHAPVKGATRLHDRHHAECGHFNPRSREGSDRSILNTTLHNIISIHAPAKGATHGRYACHLRQIISIHAPAKGATHQASDKYNPGIFQSTLPRRERRPANGRFRCAPPHFNPRSREGSDSTLCGGNLFLICISIHAPAKGATIGLTYKYIAVTISIHAPAKGATCVTAATAQRPWPFQSTLPRRERPPRSWLHAPAIDFNPRSREGSDVRR